MGCAHSTSPVTLQSCIGVAAILYEFEFELKYLCYASRFGGSRDPVNTKRWEKKIIQGVTVGVIPVYCLKYVMLKIERGNREIVGSLKV